MNTNEFNKIKKHIQPTDIYLDEGRYKADDKEAYSDGHIIIYSGIITENSKIITGNYYTPDEYIREDVEFHCEKIELLTEYYEKVEITIEQEKELIEALTLTFNTY